MPPETGEVQGPPTRAQAAAQQRAADNEAHDAYQGDTPTPKVHYRIDTSEFAILMLFAGFFDLLSIFPVVNDLIAPIANFILSGIFFLNGVSVFERKYFLTFLLTSIVEYIPFLSILPMFMAQVYYITVFSRAADVALAAATKAASKVVGKRFAGAMVGLAYGRMITGQTPVPPLLERKVAQAAKDMKPLDKTWRGNIMNFGKNVAKLGESTKFLGGAMKKGAITEFPKTMASKLLPSQRGGGASYVDGIRMPTPAPQPAETASPAPATPSHIGPASQSAVLPGSLDGVRPDVRESVPASQAGRAPEQAQKTSAGRSTESEKPTGTKTPATPYAATPKKPEEIAESEKSPEIKAQAPSEAPNVVPSERPKADAEPARRAGAQEKNVPAMAARDNSFITHDIPDSALRPQTAGFELAGATRENPFAEASRAPSLSASSVPYGRVAETAEKEPAQEKTSQWGVFLANGTIKPETGALPETGRVAPAAPEIGAAGSFMVENPEVAGVYTRLSQTINISNEITTEITINIKQIPGIDYGAWQKSYEQAVQQNVPVYAMGRGNIVRRIMNVDFDTGTVKLDKVAMTPLKMLAHSKAGVGDTDLNLDA